ncbi:hypothetical protein BGZ73_002117 [Actinomortierella ambigua]|nr:hypothetical protein BGZ73_002117 [Actinomortierella ambigua]
MQDSNETPLTQEERERIRLKRLQRLQGLENNSQQSSPTSGASAASSPVPKPTTIPPSASSPSPASPSAPAVAAAASPKSAQATKAPTPAATTPPSKSSSLATPKQPALTFEAWQNEALSRILLVSLNANAAPPLLYLSSLADELKEENEPLLISQASLDRVLVARMSIDPNEISNVADLECGQLKLTLFDYLLECWKRLETVKLQTSRARALPPNVIEERVKSLNASKDLLVSYAGLVLQMPEMFPQIASGAQLGPYQLATRLVNDPETPEGVPIEFVCDIANRFQEDGLENILGPVVANLAALARKTTILKDWRTPLRALQSLVEVPGVPAILPKAPGWNPANATPRQIEIVSALGPFFRISAFVFDEPSVADLFGSGLKRDRNEIGTAFASIRGAMRNLHASLFQVVNSIVRSSPAARDDLLNYFASVARKNEGRAKMQVDKATVSGDGFILNISEVLLKLCDPFMDANYSKVDKIATEYFKSTASKVDISKETRIASNKEVVDNYMKHAVSTPGNFISDVFFLTLAFHHIGISRICVDYKRFSRDFQDMMDQYERLKEQENAGQLSPENALLVKRYEYQLEKMTTYRLAMEAQVLDPVVLSHSFQFYNLVMVWLLRLVDPSHTYPRTKINLPLPAKPADDFAILPEYIIEDIVEFFMFTMRWAPETFEVSSLDELITFAMVFLITPGYIKNPHLKAKLVEILFYMTLPYRGIRGNYLLGMKLNSHPMALQYLVPAIMNFYVECENTGRSSQFYDKFNIRYNISQILKFVWNNAAHRDMVRSESKRQESFVRFVNLLMNDTTYLLDEGLTKLGEIREVELEMDNKEAWQAQTPQHRQEREGVLRTAQRQASSYIALGNETVNMLSYLTAEIKEPFLTPEIVDRLASMLDFNLVILVGNKMNTLKVKNPEQYQFQPKVLLSEIIDVFLHLAAFPVFVQAMARDDRSYRTEIFSKAASILQSRGLKSSDEIHALERLVNAVEEVRRQGAEDDEELGDIPDKYLDPLLYTLMEDPVILPNSKVSIDRSTIKSHLLSDAHDPFNRSPLTINEVIDDVELRNEIQAWKAAQRAKRRQQGAPSSSAAMDGDIDMQ